MGYTMMKKHVIAFNSEDVVVLYTPDRKWMTSLAMMVTQVEEVRDNIQRVEHIESIPEDPSDFIPNEWARLEYDGKKIVLDDDLRIIHNDFEEGNVYQG